MFKHALISVSDKTGLVDFVRPLVEQGMSIVSSGGTAKHLEEAGFVVKRVSEQTQFPEVMGGRVKTLHPYIHMPLLQRADVAGDQEILKEHGLQPFDLVVVNLYPFKEGLKTDKSFAEMVELIDIGGPTLLRASAKNFNSVTVVSNPADYSWILEKKEVSLTDRQYLAAKVFQQVNDYDRYIAAYLTDPQGIHTLRYGENPQQEAQWVGTENHGLHKAEILQGKALSYNNILDLDAAVTALRLFSGPTVISVKHNNPCGVAVGSNIAEALEKSLKADPVSVFGGIIALNEEITGVCAEELTSLFLECVVAPSVSAEAKEVFAAKKNLRVLTWPQVAQMEDSPSDQMRSVLGGFLKQTTDQVQSRDDSWELVCGQLSEEDWQGLEFAWKVCSCLKSNAIAVTSAKQSLGLGMGQVNRVDAVDQAFQRASQFHGEVATKYLASDAFFPFPDSIELAAKHGAKAIIQPGGSIKDEAVIAKAKELNIPMVFTGRRHFRH